MAEYLPRSDKLSPSASKTPAKKSTGSPAATLASYKSTIRRSSTETTKKSYEYYVCIPKLIYMPELDFLVIYYQVFKTLIINISQRGISKLYFIN